MDEFIKTDIHFSTWIIMSIGILLLIISAFMSSSEVAFFSLSPKDIEEVKEGKNDSDKYLQKMLADSERLLATILIGNNFVNVAIVMLLSVSLSQIFNFGANETLQFIIETILLTLLLLLFGEIIPKVYAQGRSLSFSRFAADKMYFFFNILKPFSSFLMNSSNLVTKRVQSKKYNISVDDLAQAVDLLEDGSNDSKAMFTEIVNFYNKTASEVMTPRIDMVAVDINMPFDKMLEYVLESRYSRIPVYDGSQDNIKGLLYIKDLIPHRNKEADFQWQNIIRKAHFVPENKKIDDLLEEARKNKIHLSIVVDEYGGTSGVISLEDILEEILGEISDEYDEEELPYKKQSDGSYIFEAKTPIVDFLRYLGLESGIFGEYEDAVDTLGGLFIEAKKDLPKKNDILDIGSWRFKVIEIERFRIIQLQISEIKNI